jgi:Glycosyl transferase family 11
MYQQLSGRLGNQLFEWAFAHKIASHYNKPVKLFHDRFHLSKPGDDLTSLGYICSHHVEVSQANHTGLLLKILDFSTKYFRGITNFAEKMGILRSNNSFLLPILTRSRPRVISGFCINKLVVEEFETELEEDLCQILDSVVLLVPSELNYQVIHVRKGDYLTTDTSYGVLTADYYLKNLGSEKISIVVTDDLDGAPEIVRRIKPNYVFTPRNSTAWETLKIMQHSNRLLMANSTLSWWGGFLASRRGSQVISPNPFYSNLDEKTNSLLQAKYFKLASSEFLTPQ